MSERATDELFSDDEPQVSDVVETPVVDAAEAPAVQDAVAEIAQEPAAAPVVTQPEAQADRDRDLAGLIKALQDEREQKRAAKEEAAALRTWREEQERKRQQAQQQRPHLLDDPEGYDAWWQNHLAETVGAIRKEVAASRLRDRIEASTEKWTDKLGEEQFNELYQWTATMPPAWVKWAESQRDPFGVAHKEFEKQAKAKRAAELDQQLGGKTLEQLVEERVAARLAEAPAPAPATPERARASNGQYAPTPPEQQRHRPGSLAGVNGMSVPGGAAQGSALDGLFSD